MCTMFGSLDHKVYHRPLEKHSHETGRGGPQEVQQNTSIPRVFVLGALVPAVLLATWWVRPPSMTVGVGNPTTAAKQHSRFSRLITHSFTSHSYRQAAAMLKSRVFFVDLIFIASSDAQVTKCVDASCGYGTAGVSETGLLEFRTCSSWCSCSVRLFPPCCLQWWAEWAIRQQRQSSTHSSQASCKLFELFITRFFDGEERQAAFVKHVCEQTYLHLLFLACAGAGTRVQHQSSSFTPLGIVTTRLGLREMVNTHGHVSRCLPVNNEFKVVCAILCCGRLLEIARTSVAFLCVCVALWCK